MFDSPRAASRHYGIKGTTTVRGWLRRLGKDHLLRKLVRVEAVGEADRVGKVIKPELIDAGVSMGRDRFFKLL